MDEQQLAKVDPLTGERGWRVPAAGASWKGAGRAAPAQHVAAAAPLPARACQGRPPSSLASLPTRPRLLCAAAAQACCTWASPTEPPTCWGVGGWRRRWTPCSPPSSSELQRWLPTVPACTLPVWACCKACHPLFWWCRLNTLASMPCPPPSTLPTHLRGRRCCQAGKDAADALLDAPGMVDALKEVLDAPPPPPAAPGGAPPGDAGAAAACYGARPKALRLLRQLACSSKAAARLLQESGAVRFALEHLLRSLGGGGAAAAADARQLGALTESLRLWRCFAQHGFFLLLLDDAYPTLCPHLAPPLPAHAAAAALAGQPMTLLPGELRGWCVAREAFSTAAQLCWHAARCVCVFVCVGGGAGGGGAGVRSWVLVDGRR